MALTNQLINEIKAHAHDQQAIIGILNRYNTEQKPYNRLHGEDILNAYRIGGIYVKPSHIIGGAIYEDQPQHLRTRFYNHI